MYKFWVPVMILIMPMTLSQHKITLKQYKNLKCLSKLLVTIEIHVHVIIIFKKITKLRCNVIYNIDQSGMFDIVYVTLYFPDDNHN